MDAQSNSGCSPGPQSPTGTATSQPPGNRSAALGKALLESQIQYAAIVNSAMDAIITADSENRICLFNPAAESMFGYAADEVLGQRLDLLLPDRFRARHAAHMSHFADTNDTSRRMGALGAVSGRRKSGEEFPIEASISHASIDGQRFFTAILRDITERQRADARFHLAVEAAPNAMLMVDRDGKLTMVNSQAERLFGYSRDSLLGKNIEMLVPERFRSVHAIQRGAFFQQPSVRAMGKGRDLFGLRSDGSEVPIEIGLNPVDSPDGIHVLASVIDITERRHAEEALRASEERFRELAETIHEVFWITDARTQQLLYVSPAYQTIWGMPCESLHANPLSWLDSVHPDDSERVRAAMNLHDPDGAGIEFRILRPDSSTRWILARNFPVRNELGTLMRVVGVAQDITERNQLEAQLRQSQKLEAVGQLAGGVAHDFNNILSVILVHSELLAANFPEGSSERESLNDVHEAAQRASNLTRQLLAFSRREVVQPKLLDLNQVVGDLDKMLKRLIGEDIRFNTVLHPTLGMISADPGHIEQIIVNLVVNSRDAMPRGGTLTIETQDAILDAEAASAIPDARPGQYAVLVITDSGCGMTSSVLSRIFEPFFTTKAVGHGTGLGLAVVHGIVKQNNAFIAVHSERGIGTTFRIAFPTIQHPRTIARTSEASSIPTGNESILLVEDDPAVRRVAALGLTTLGYTVLTADSGHSALEVAAAHRNAIALLLTDVVMPGMSGRELADILRQRQPDLRVLFQSGYTNDAVVRHGVLHAEVEFIQKPYRLQMLASKIRAILDAKN